MEALFLILLFVQLMVLWQSCQRQPINLYIYINDSDEDDDPPTRLEGDEWKDKEGNDATV